MLPLLWPRCPYPTWQAHSAFWRSGLPFGFAAMMLPMLCTLFCTYRLVFVCAPGYITTVPMAALPFHVVERNRQGKVRLNSLPPGVYRLQSWRTVTQSGARYSDPRLFRTPFGCIGRPT